MNPTAELFEVCIEQALALRSGPVVAVSILATRYIVSECTALLRTGSCELVFPGIHSRDLALIGEAFPRAKASLRTVGTPAQ